MPAGNSETIPFAFAGHVYKIDLANKNVAALRKAFLTYIENGRRVTTSRCAKVKRPPIGAGPKTIKEWREQRLRGQRPRAGPRRRACGLRRGRRQLGSHS